MEYYLHIFIENTFDHDRFNVFSYSLHGIHIAFMSFQKKLQNEFSIGWIRPIGNKPGYKYFENVELHNIRLASIESRFLGKVLAPMVFYALKCKKSAAGL